MRHISLAASLAVLVLANALALMHAAQNRAGAPTAELTLTDRELNYSPNFVEDNSGVTLSLRWTPDEYNGFSSSANDWLDRQKLTSLGFDCSADPSKADAQNLSRRQRPREAFVALEYNGPAWQKWLQGFQRFEESNRLAGGSIYDQSKELSQLILVDADLNPSMLRMRHPDRSTVVILPAVIGISIVDWRRDQPTHYEGNIREIPFSIYVPRPFGEPFRRRVPGNPGQIMQQPYSVHLRFGRFFEPWVTAVDFPK